MDEDINMSLDDYIKKSSRVSSPAQKVESSGIPERFRRIEAADHDESDEEDEVIGKSPADSSGEGPDLEVIISGEDQTSATVEVEGAEEFDLRQCITGLMPDINSPQWRITYPNNHPRREQGMPQLVPQTVLQNLRGYGRRRRWNHNQTPRCYGVQHRHRNNNNYNNGHANQRDNNGVNFSRFNSAKHMQLLNSVDGNAIIQRSNNNNNYHNHFMRDMQVDQPSDAIDLQPSRSYSRFQVNAVSRTSRSGCPVSTNDASQKFIIPTNAHSESQNNSMMQSKQLEGNGDPALVPSRPDMQRMTLIQLMGMDKNDVGDTRKLFSNFIDWMQEIKKLPLHKPMYDMQIQKEIHDLQKKPLFYKSSDTPAVISSDGEGIDCAIIPRTSSMSLNCRFT